MFYFLKTKFICSSKAVIRMQNVVYVSLVFGCFAIFDLCDLIASFKNRLILLFAIHILFSFGHFVFINVRLIISCHFVLLFEMINVFYFANIENYLNEFSTIFSLQKTQMEVDTYKMLFQHHFPFSKPLCFEIINFAQTKSRFEFVIFSQLSNNKFHDHVKLSKFILNCGKLHGEKSGNKMYL